MNKIKSLILGAALAIAAIGPVGCATSQTGGQGQTVQDYTPAITTAALFGTHYTLQERPDWKPYFTAAAAELAVLETAEKIDFNTILAVVLRLPVKELNSPDARLAIAGATILLQGYSGKIVELDKLENVRPIARALREGITLGIGTP